MTNDTVHFFDVQFFLKLMVCIIKKLQGKGIRSPWPFQRQLSKESPKAHSSKNMSSYQDI